ncbi:molybdenum cofactor sulfurase-like [Anneissia japonica]|uniref:molybdenum cofactor sulfurase-like n=1 Tax=Anneissia japonica TaxID=1529436 RepID=UPI0014256A77|nr:molybdenum cofactor sulfurase-like [Anneissia japonica]
MNDKIESEFPLLQDVVYLDHAAATLYAKSQLESYVQDLSSHVYGNPHSRSQSSQLTAEVIEHVRERILRHFGTSSETHSVIFTANCTGAIKLVAETFKWNTTPTKELIRSTEHDARQNPVFLYLKNSHTSVVGMREYASKHGADFGCINEQEVQTSLETSQAVTESALKGELPNCLFAYPAQCNFSGRKYPLNWTNRLKSYETATLHGCCGRWCVLLDAASYVMTSKLDLGFYCADFVPVSFYKMFGFPTGIGGLIIRNESVSFLQKTFFGGGTVQAYSSSENFHIPKLKIHEWFEDGTLPFLNIVALRHGFDTLQGLAGGINQISQHTFTLARYIHHELESYYHSNGKPVAILYHDNGFEDITIQGAIVNFNLLRENGDYVGYAEVDKLANLYNIQLRTGCFCNTGACQKFLGLTSEKVKNNFQAGHSCGDDNDLIDGQPTGSVRISFGYMSRWKDAERFLQFIRECFVSGTQDTAAQRLNKISNTQVEEPLLNDNTPQSYQKKDEIDPSLNHNGHQNKKTRLPDSGCQEPIETGLNQYIHEIHHPDPETRINQYLHKMFIYPIKSCGAVEVKEWKLGAKGFVYDREWMVVNENDVALNQKRNTKLCLIKPNIDLGKNVLILNTKGKTPCTVPLEIEETLLSESSTREDPRVCESRVCMDRVQGIDCGQEVSDWLSDVLGQRCRLIKQNHRYKRHTNRIGETAEVSFVNESQFLLVNKASINHLLKYIQQRQCITDVNVQDTVIRMDLDNLTARFRANFVISGQAAFEEDEWKEVYIHGVKFKVVGPC